MRPKKKKIKTPRVLQGSFNRWFIFHPENDRLAWSGSRWVPCWPDGFPAGSVQVCNFPNMDEARAYIKTNHYIDESLNDITA